MSGRPLTSKDSGKRARPERRAKTTREASGPERKRLVDTEGPDPHTPLESVVFKVGQVVGSHGRGGTLKVRIFSDEPEHLLAIDAFTLGNEIKPRTVTGSQLHAGQLLLTLEGIETPEDAAHVVNLPVRLPAAKLPPLAPGEYFIYQLLGLTVETEEGAPLGTVTDIIETGANDVLVVDPGNGAADLLLPMIPAVILDIDPTGGSIIARPLAFYGDP